MTNDLITKYGNRVRTHSLEVAVNNLGGKYFLPDDSILRNKTIVGLTVQPPIFDEANSVYFTVNSFATDTAIADAPMFYNAYISLMNNNVELISGMPLLQFGTYPPDRRIQEIFVDILTPNKSFITVADPANNVTEGTVFQLNFVYLD